MAVPLERKSCKFETVSEVERGRDPKTVSLSGGGAALAFDMVCFTFFFLVDGQRDVQKKSKAMYVERKRIVVV